MKISMKEFLKLNNPIIIDIREKDEYDSGHLNGAINISMNKIILNPEKYLSKNKTYFIYCQEGKITKVVCNILSKLEYRVVEIEGGYNSIKYM